MTSLASFPIVPPPPRTRRERLAALLGLAWGALVAALFLAGVLDPAGDRLSDWEQTCLASSAPENDFGLIPITRVPSDRPWPWPRLDYAVALRALVNDLPQSVVFEVPVHDQDPRYSAFDPSFRTVIEREHPDTVVFSAAGLQHPGATPVPEGLGALRLAAPKGKDASPVAAFGSVLWPVPTFAAGCPVGLSNFSVEPGRTLRRVPLLFRFDGKLLPSLSLSAAAVRLGADLNRSEFAPADGKVVLRDASGRVLRRIPVDEEGRLRLRFRKPGREVPRIAYDDFLVAADQQDRGVPPSAEPRRFAGRQVWVGATDPSAAEPVRTAVGPLAPVEIQLQAAAQIVGNDLVADVPRSLVAVLVVVTAMMLAYATQRLATPGAVVLAAGVAGTVFVAALVAFVAANVAFPLFPLFAAAAGAVLCSRAATYWDLPPSPDLASHAAA